MYIPQFGNELIIIKSGDTILPASLTCYCCTNVINNEPGLPYSSVNQIKLLCKALSVVNPEEKENEILQDLVHVAIHTKPG